MDNAKNTLERNEELQERSLQQKTPSNEVIENERHTVAEIVHQNGGYILKKPSILTELSEAQIILDAILQPKTRIDPLLYEQLKQSLSDKGQKEYVHVFLGEDGKYHLYDGHQRFQIVFKDLKLPKIKASIDDITFEEALRLCVDLNRNTPLTVQDEAEFYDRLLIEQAAMFPNQKAIITVYNVPQSRLSQIMSYRKTIKNIEPHLSEAEKSKVKRVKEFVSRPLQKIPQPDVQAAAFVATAEKKLTYEGAKKLATAITEKNITNREDAEKEITSLFSAYDNKQQERQLLKETPVILPEETAEKALGVLEAIEEKPSKSDVQKFFGDFTEKLLIMVPPETVEDALELAASKYRGVA